MTFFKRWQERSFRMVERQDEARCILFLIKTFREGAKHAAEMLRMFQSGIKNIKSES